MSRRHVRRLLRAWQLDDLTDTATLIASELVTNAVTATQALGGALQGPPPLLALGVRRTERNLIIEVRDPSPSPPAMRRPGPMDEDGRGLLLIEMLAAGWGHERAGDGSKVVWCEIALADPDARPRPDACPHPEARPRPDACPHPEARPRPDACPRPEARPHPDPRHHPGAAA